MTEQNEMQRQETTAPQSSVKFPNGKCGQNGCENDATQGLWWDGSPMLELPGLCDEHAAALNAASEVQL